MIERKNILDLIGKHRKKYHSCIMTCYSFDFSFFEERVLPTLRSANIKNVNVLADGHYLEMAQEATTGKEFKHNKTYNFQVVYQKGVFHPKIMLLTGAKHGLLIIGSGNISSSGLSTNDEIWGAFHLNHVDNENAALFAAVWKYLQPYLNQSFGFVSQKIDWIRKYSPWLAELPSTDNWINLKSLGLELKFIANQNKESTFKQLKSNIPNLNVEDLTVISPYYDKSGQQLKQLKEHFNPLKMSCLVDTNSGLLPSNLDDTIASQINFHSWAECKEDYEEDYNRLHAKLISIRLQEEEYLLLGSANATMAGMGSVESTAANGEAGILLKRKTTSKNWIEELKIKIPKSTIKIQHVVNHGLGVGSVPRVNYKYRILYAELRADELSIYLNKDCSEEIEVNSFDRSDLVLESTIKKIVQNTIIIQVKNPENVFKLTLVDDKKNRISNYCLVHRFEALLRCNPNPSQEKLDTMMEQDFPDGEGVTNLLQFVDYNWADDETNSINKTSKRNSATIGKAEKREQEKDFEILNSDEFNKISTESLLKQMGELSNPTVKIAEFLNLYVIGTFSKDDFEESEEQRLLEDKEQKGEGKEAGNTKRKRIHGSKEKAAMKKYFKKLDDIYKKRLAKFLKTQALTEVPTTLINIRSLSSILIAIQLIHLKHGKKFTISSPNPEENGDDIIKEETYITSGASGTSVDNVKGFLLNVLGKFLLLSGAGNKQYEFDILNQKLVINQFQLLVKSTYLILNISWRESERRDRDLLLLNTLYFSLHERILDDEVVQNFVNKLNEFKTKAFYISPKFQEQLKYFTEETLINYLGWLEIYMDQDKKKTLLLSTSNLKYGNIIFNSKIGFNLVKKVIAHKLVYNLHLSRAGYSFSKGEFALKNLQFGSKCIKYR